MCGISGFVDFSKKSSEVQLKMMSDTIVHRGPDGEGYHLYELENANVGIAHRRLSIIDLSEGGKQPMHYEHLSITYNGEIYNYQEIKEELIQKGHSFTSHSDTEVILHGFMEWGAAVVNKFIGMFAFVIFNSKDRELFCCRDRAGVKPFFYYHTAEIFLFASELKAIVAHPAFLKELNKDAVGAFLQFGYVPHPHCIYKNTNKLSPGHFLRLTIRLNTIKTEQYWNVYDAYNKPKLKIGFDECLEETERLLTSACKYRMVSDVPVGIFLSGGYDSSTVTALLQKDSTKKIKTFTIGFTEASVNEAPYAKKVAEYLGTDHIEHYCTEKEALDIIPDLPYFFDEPFADSSAIPTTLVSKIARQHVTVALSADAGDEVFAGYNRYDYLSKFGGKVKSLPPLIRRSIASVMNKVSADSIPVLRNQYLFHSRYEKVKQFLLEPDDYKMNLVLSKQFSENEVTSLLKLPVSRLLTAFDSKELKPENYDTLSYVMAIDYQTYLADDIMQKVDRAAMSHSLEGREPFLDHRVIEWAASLPMEYKYNKGVKKYILRQITHKYLPKEMMERPKMGFAIPVATWLDGQLKPLVDHYLSSDYLEMQQLFNTPEVLGIVHAFYTGKKERAEKIWYLLMFQMWYEKWIKI